MDGTLKMDPYRRADERLVRAMRRLTGEQLAEIRKLHGLPLERVLAGRGLSSLIEIFVGRITLWANNGLNDLPDEASRREDPRYEVFYAASDLMTVCRPMGD